MIYHPHPTANVQEGALFDDLGLQVQGEVAHLGVPDNRVETHLEEVARVLLALTQRQIDPTD
jgi:hypothetical protein